MHRKIKDEKRNERQSKLEVAKEKATTTTPTTTKNVKSINATTNSKNANLIDKRKTFASATSSSLIKNSIDGHVARMATKTSVSRPTTKTVATTKNVPISKDDSKTKPIIKPKAIVASMAGPSSRSQPMKATYVPKKPAKISDKNVMNTIHNVTVASPPSQRKEIPINVVEPLQKQPPLKDHLDRDRTKTRTLEPEEILILKDNPENVEKNKKSTFAEATNIVSAVSVKEPVAFEINFEDEKLKTSTKTSPLPKQQSPPESPSDFEYEEDFESYESDFESVTTSTPSSNRSSESLTNSESSKSDSHVSASEKIPTPSSDIASKNLDEKQFDSGHYDLKSQVDLHQMEPEKDISSSDGQIDSGIGYDAIKSADQIDSISLSHTVEVIQSSTVKSKSHPQNTRGRELMNKIHLDTMTYQIFELKPLSYDYYMKIYGHSNTNQCSTQTNEDNVDEDTQTDQPITQSIWTQWPPYFSIKNIQTSDYYQYRIGCGYDNEKPTINDQDHYTFDGSLKIIQSIKDDSRQNHISGSLNSIDHDRLSRFLQKSAITVAGILAANNKKIETSKSKVPGCKEYFLLNLKKLPELSKLQIKMVYSSSDIRDFLYVVHEEPLNKCQTFISIWNLSDSSNPINILSTWGSVCCLLVPGLFKDVVLAGLSDGSISFWHLSESSYWHSGKNDQRTVYVPSQIILPQIDKSTNLPDLGRVISIKCLTDDEMFSLDRSPSHCQVASLHEFGIITLWTIMFSVAFDKDTIISKDIERLDHQSPWSNMKLIQIRSLDLRAILQTIIVRPKSGFEKTKSYFENDLFSDAALRELQNRDRINDRQQSQVDLMCFDLEFHKDSFYIATNQKFLLIGNRSLLRQSFRKIMLDDAAIFIHSTSLKSLQNQDIILIGQSNGSVKVLQTESSQMFQSNQEFENDECPSTSSSPSPMFDLHQPNIKSCAIQNIIKDERRKQYQQDSRYTDKIDHSINLRKNVENDIIMDLNSRELWPFVNDQLLLNGLSFYQHYTKSIYLSNQTKYLYAHCENRLRIVDLATNTEIMMDDHLETLNDFTLIKGNGKREFLALLIDHKLQIHMIRKMKG